MKAFNLWLWILIGLVGCGQTDSPDTPVPEKDLNEDAKFISWLDEHYMEELAFLPMRKAFFGIKDDDYGLVGDYSEEGLDRALEWRRKSVTEMKARFDYQALSSEGRESYDLWEYVTTQAVAARSYRSNEYLFTQQARAQPYLPQLIISWHDVETPADAKSYINRIRSASDSLMQLVRRAESSADNGIRPPYFAFANISKEARHLISGRPFSDDDFDNPIWQDFKQEVDKLRTSGEIDDSQSKALQGEARDALLEAWEPAYKALLDWLDSDRSNATKFARGVSSLPNGAEYYKERLKFHTTTNLGADEIHALGLEHVERLHGSIEQVKTAIHFEGTLPELFSYLRDTKDDRDLYFPNTDEGRSAYLEESRALLTSLQKQLPAFFGVLPKAGLVVKRVESYREQAGAAQHYIPSTPDGSRPGVYYAHLIDMNAMPRWDMESVTYHEGVPGHHLQSAIARELQNVPLFRKTARFTAFGEGWGLYSEALAKEMAGTYSDPYSEIGRLSAELWRAIRLVVDTGLHAYGWSEEQAVDYMIQNGILTQGQARAEIRRYLVDPGQATAYMVGNLKILELRERAEKKLGKHFDLREFHDLVLSGGELPLTLLERKVDRWLDAR